MQAYPIQTAENQRQRKNLERNHKEKNTLPNEEHEEELHQDSL